MKQRLSGTMTGMLSSGIQPPTLTSARRRGNPWGRGCEVVFWALDEGFQEKGLAVMSRGVAGKVLVVLVSAGLCAAVTGCSLSWLGEWFGGKNGRVEGEPAKGREAGSGPPADAAAAVSPRAGRGLKGEAPETPGEAGGPEAGAEDYRVILSFSDLGVIEIVLAGEGVARGAWRSADAEARKRCRVWGYEEAAGNVPLERVRLYRCQGKVASEGEGDEGQATPVLWRTGDFRRVLWNFRGRAEQGDEKALEMVQGLAAQRGDLKRRAERGGAKAWTGWMFSVLMASGGEVRSETWRCFPRGEGRNSESEVMLGRLSEAGGAFGIGEVFAFGLSHPAVVRALGSELRWDFGRGPWRELPHAFVIEPDGGGYHFDVSSSENAQAESRRVFDCEVLR